MIPTDFPNPDRPDSPERTEALGRYESPEHFAGELNLYDQVADVIALHKPKAKADYRKRPGYCIWSAGCSTCRWVGELHDDAAFDAHLAQAVGDLLIDLAGTGRLLASIDRIARTSEESA